MAKPILVIHGGAGSGPCAGESYDKYVKSMSTIAEKAFAVLKKGGSALDAVVAASVLLEDDPIYNAGKGSKIQSDGKIRMSASLMDGAEQRFSGCINVEGVKNPIHLARALLNHEDRVLGGRGARQYAKQLGLPFASPFTKKCREDYKARLKGKTGTIGALALDKKGRLAAATSTGGRGFEYPHRVSDSPTVAGNFATAKAAVSATGKGEAIVDHSAAASICALVDAGWTLEKSVKHVLGKAKKHGATFGLIALDGKGRFVATTTTKTLIWAAATADGVEVFKATH